ncbi:MAG: response regulator, partial [Synergistaceae bacterium]|nr:response regulator [Synergistaceae bacterium]
MIDNKRSAIMILDGDAMSLEAAGNALAGFYDVYTERTPCGMFEALGRRRPELILLDVDKPETDGFETIKTLKGAGTRDIPVIIMTSLSDTDNALKGLSLGAADYVTKPFIPELLRKRVDLCLTLENQRRALFEQTRRIDVQNTEVRRFNEEFHEMVEEKAEKALELRSDIMKTVAAIVESRDDFGGGNVGRTQLVLETLIGALLKNGAYEEQLRSWDTDLMLRASRLCLHDVGKLAARDSILGKPGRLTADEFEELKGCLTRGVRIIDRIESETSQSDLLKYARVYADTIREKWDGSGYPNGLAGEGIPLPGRLMAIADAYDALTSARPYKKASSHDEAVQIIAEGA